MRVDVYWNLTKKCWSIRDAKTKRVVEHLPSLLLKDVTFVVQPAGSAKVKKEKRKNVHAWAKGTLVDYNIWNKVEPQPESWPGWEEITYNPYRHTSFVFVVRLGYCPQTKLKSATKALFRSNGDVYVQGGE